MILSTGRPSRVANDRDDGGRGRRAGGRASSCPLGHGGADRRARAGAARCGGDRTALARRHRRPVTNVTRGPPATDVVRVLLVYPSIIFFRVRDRQQPPPPPPP